MSSESDGPALICCRYRLVERDGWTDEFSFCLEREGPLTGVAVRGGETLYSVWEGGARGARVNYLAVGDRLRKGPGGVSLAGGRALRRVRELLQRRGLMPEERSPLQGALDALDALDGPSARVRLAGFDGTHPDHRPEAVSELLGMLESPVGTEEFVIDDDPELLGVARRAAAGLIDSDPGPPWGAAGALGGRRPLQRLDEVDARAGAQGAGLRGGPAGGRLGRRTSLGSQLLPDACRTPIGRSVGARRTALTGVPGTRASFSMCGARGLQGMTCAPRGGSPHTYREST